MSTPVSRRQIFAAAAVASAGCFAEEPATAAPRWRVRYCLNTATLRHLHFDLPRLAAIAVAAGYRSLEPWLDEIERYVAGGGSPREFAGRARASGLTIENVIAFPEWLGGDALKRQSSLDRARSSMELVASIGGTRIAAPPQGATEGAPIPLSDVAERYGALLQVGKETGVIPQLEVWGFSANLRTLADAAWVAVQTGDPAARIVPDMMHLFRGGSPISGLRAVAGRAIDVFHMNDYPAGLSANVAQDSDRRFPGKGAAPISEALRALCGNGFAGALSLEVFGGQDVQGDPVTVAREGLRLMKAAVDASLQPEPTDKEVRQTP